MSDWFVKHTSLNETASSESVVCRGGTPASKVQTTLVSSTACPIQDDVVLKRSMSAFEVDPGKLFSPDVLEQFVLARHGW